jgi:NurA-like 5'-3' nuclease
MDEVDMSPTEPTNDGQLVNEDELAEMIDERERDERIQEDREKHPHAQEPVCDLCGNKQATKRGVHVYAGRVSPHSPLCDDCFIPIEDITLPDYVDDDFKDNYEDEDIEAVELPDREAA